MFQVWCESCCGVVVFLSINYTWSCQFEKLSRITQMEYFSKLLVFVYFGPLAHFNTCINGRCNVSNMRDHV